MNKYNLKDKETIKAIMKKIDLKGFHCFTSESQFRDLFALTIAQNNSNFDIFPEFSPPKSAYPGTPYFNNKKSLHFDLLVTDKSTNDKFLFEFKYKTKALENVKVMDQCFDLKNQNDFTNGRYDVWEDVYRIERFSASNNGGFRITCGYVIFLTNYKGYLIEPSPDCKSRFFSLNEGDHEKGEKNWIRLDADYKGIHDSNHEKLDILNAYTFEHEKYSTVNGSEFKYLLIRVCGS